MYNSTWYINLHIIYHKCHCKTPDFHHTRHITWKTCFTAISYTTSHSILIENISCLLFDFILFIVIPRTLLHETPWRDFLLCKCFVVLTVSFFFFCTFHFNDLDSCPEDHIFQTYLPQFSLKHLIFFIKFYITFQCILYKCNSMHINSLHWKTLFYTC